MKGKFLKVASVGMLALALAACGGKGGKEEEKKAEANLPKLEVTFATFADDTATEDVNEADENLNHISYGKLKEKFEGGYNFLLMYGNSECSTCAAVKSALGRWIAAHHYEVYYINEHTEGTAADKAAVMEKLGNPTSYPFLYAVHEGEEGSAVVDSLTFANSKAASEERINNFIKKNFELEDDKFQATVKKFRNLAELRKAVKDNEKFVLYVTRNGCPDCQKSADIKRDDNLTVFFKSFRGNFYEIVSEEVIAEHVQAGVAGSVDGATFKDVVGTAVSTTALLKDTYGEWLVKDGNAAAGDYYKSDDTADYTNITRSMNVSEINAKAGLKVYNNAGYFLGWTNVQVAEQLSDAVASGVFTEAELALGTKDFYVAAINKLRATTGFNEVTDKANAKLGMYYTTAEAPTEYNLIETAEELATAKATATNKIYETVDDGTAFLRKLRSTPTVVASGYASVKNVNVSASRTTIYDSNTGKAIGYKKSVSQKANATGSDATKNGYTGTNRIAFKLGQELDDSAAIGGRGSANAAETPNYLYWYNMNPDNITPRDNNANACYNTPEYIARIQADIIAWANSWLINWSASVTPAA